MNLNGIKHSFVKDDKMTLKLYNFAMLMSIYFDQCFYSHKTVYPLYVYNTSPLLAESKLINALKIYVLLVVCATLHNGQVFDIYKNTIQCTSSFVL